MDYRLELKIRNNRILEHIENSGSKTIGEFCRNHPLLATDNSNIGELVNMKVSPLNREGSFIPVVLRLCEVLVCSPEDLFTHDQMMAAVESNKRTLKVNEAQVQFMLTQQQEPMLLEDSRAIDERDKALMEMLEFLTPREAKVIKHRFGLDGHEELTLRETGDLFGVTAARIREIEGKALRKLRHPTRSACIKDFTQQAMES